jgi:hypothetical protein
MSAKNVMQLERAPHRGSFKLGSKNAAKNVMQLERATNRGSFKLGSKNGSKKWHAARESD